MSSSDIISILLLVVSIILYLMLVASYCRLSLLSPHKTARIFGITSGKSKRHADLNLPFLNQDAFLPLLLLPLTLALAIACQITSFDEPHALLYYALSVLLIAILTLLVATRALLKATPQNYQGALSLRLRRWLLASYTSLIHLMPRRVRDFRLVDRHAPLQPSEPAPAATQEEMVKDILQFAGETVRDIMTPRLDIVDLDIRTPFNEVLRIIADNKYSRIPVYSVSRDNIVGILYIKDLLPYLHKPTNFRWSTLVRPHLCVPETKKIDNLLHEFQAQKIHMAIAIDEYGGVAGIVTLEDIIEEIVGEINDEYDDDRRPYVVLDDHSYIFDAKVSIPTFCKILLLDESLFDDYDADTLAGLLLSIVGDMPHKHQHINLHQLHFEILEVDERHISKVRLNIDQQPS